MAVCIERPCRRAGINHLNRPVQEGCHAWWKPYLPVPPRPSTHTSLEMRQRDPLWPFLPSLPREQLQPPSVVPVILLSWRTIRSACAGSLKRVAWLGSQPFVRSQPFGLAEGGLGSEYQE